MIQFIVLIIALILLCRWGVSVKSRNCDQQKRHIESENLKNAPAEWQKKLEEDPELKKKNSEYWKKSQQRREEFKRKYHT